MNYLLRKELAIFSKPSRRCSTSILRGCKEVAARMWLQYTATRMWSPGRGCQDVVTRKELPGCSKQEGASGTWPTGCDNPKDHDVVIRKGPPGCGHQEVAARMWSPGRGFQDMVAKMWSPERGHQDVAARMWSPGSDCQDVATIEWGHK